MRLTVERAREIGTELGCWFGPPILTRSPVRVLASPDDILDGRVRYKALARIIDPSTYPNLVFPLSHRRGLYAVGKRQHLLPKLLWTCGHPDRAYLVIPPEWLDSVQAIESFVGVSRSAAIEIHVAGRQAARFAAGKVAQYKRARERTPESTRQARELISMIRTGLQSRAEGEAFELEDIARIVGFR